MNWTELNWTPVRALLSSNRLFVACISQELRVHTSNVQRMLPVTLVRPSLAALRYVVYFGLWMTSCLSITGQIKATQVGRDSPGSSNEPGRSLLSTVALLELHFVVVAARLTVKGTDWIDGHKDDDNYLYRHWALGLGKLNYTLVTQNSGFTDIRLLAQLKIKKLPVVLLSTNKYRID